jgi:DNA-directed RNA polymerase specialized sigma24 family protein
VLGIRLWVRRIRRTIRTIEYALEPALEATAPPPGRPDRRAAALAEQVRQRAHGALLELDQAERAITSADVAGTGL